MILVTGATGRIGGAVVDRLVEGGFPVRAFARRPGTRTFPSGVEVIAGDFEDPDSLSPALEGVEAVFLLWPSGNDATARDVVERIAAETGRVVYLSSMGVPLDPADAMDPINASHSLLEQLIRSSGASWTFVRSGGLAANTLAWTDDVRRESVVREPFGGIPRPLVHEQDLADIVYLALTDETHAGSQYDINGPAVVTGAEQVQSIGEALGRGVALQPLDREQAISRFGTDSWSSEFAEHIVDQWELMAAAVPEQPTGQYERLTGRAGRPFRQWARDHRDEFS